MGFDMDIYIYLYMVYSSSMTFYVFSYVFMWTCINYELPCCPMHSLCFSSWFGFFYNTCRATNLLQRATAQQTWCQNKLQTKNQLLLVGFCLLGFPCAVWFLQWFWWCSSNCFSLSQGWVPQQISADSLTCSCYYSRPSTTLLSF